jgi:hypothetical protein
MRRWGATLFGRMLHASERLGPKRCHHQYMNALLFGAPFSGFDHAGAALGRHYGIEWFREAIPGFDELPQLGEPDDDVSAALQTVLDLVYSREYRAIHLADATEPQLFDAFRAGVRQPGKISSESSSLQALAHQLSQQLLEKPGNRWCSVSRREEALLAAWVDDVPQKTAVSVRTLDSALELLRLLNRIAVPLAHAPGDSPLGNEEVREIAAKVAFALKSRLPESAWTRFDPTRRREVRLTQSEMDTTLQQAFLDNGHLDAFTRVFTDWLLVETENYDRDAVERLRVQQSRAREAYERESRKALARLFQPLVDVADEIVRREQSRALQVEPYAEFPMPPPQPYGVSPEGAEVWVRDMVRFLGAHDAEETRYAADGGVDVLSSRFSISVKHYRGTVPVEEVREIFAVAVQSGKEAMLWTSGKLTSAGLEFARVAPVRVVYCDVTTGSLTTPIDDDADVLGRGLGPVPLG